MDDVCIGRVAHYYGDPREAVLALTDMIHVGDWLHLVGHTTDFVEPVMSLQIGHQTVQAAGLGQQVALRVKDRVRVQDAVYRMTADEPKELEQERTLHVIW